jgi:hypothetical protein
MPRTLLTLTAFALLVALAGTAAQPPAKDGEPLPDYPKADPNSVVIENPKQKGLVMEVRPDKKSRRVGLVAEVCLREGPLEVLLCKKGTKEHEAILRADQDAKDIHELLILAGAEPGRPAQFVNPKTQEAEFKPATGTAIRVLVHYRKDGKLHTHPAGDWVWNSAKKQPLRSDWIFAGSRLIKDPDNPAAKPFYGANSGEGICISNFPYAMLDLPFEVGKDDAVLNYEAKTDRIPPLWSKVWVVLEPVPAGK